MGFRRRRLGNIQSIKHIVDIQRALVIGTTTAVNLISTVDQPDSTLVSTSEVQTGSKVTSIFLNIEGSATTSAALANVYAIVYKNPNSIVPTIAPNTVGANVHKKFVIHQEMAMVERSTAGNPRSIFKGVIMIPKGYQRFGTSDALVLSMLSPGVTLDNCVQCIFKEIR